MESSCKYSVNRVFSGLADHWHYSNLNTSLSSLSSSLLLSFSNPGTIFMFTVADSGLIMLCLEGFFYGNISVLCALSCTLANQLFPGHGLGLYSGIFAIYLHCPSKESRTATIIFYVLCLLYVLSAATFVCDLLSIIIQLEAVSNNSICKNIINVRISVTYQYTITSTSI